MEYYEYNGEKYTKKWNVLRETPATDTRLWSNEEETKFIEVTFYLNGCPTSIKQSYDRRGEKEDIYYGFV